MVLDYLQMGDNDYSFKSPFNGGMLNHSSPKGFGVLRLNVKYMRTEYVYTGSRGKTILQMIRTKLITGMN